MKSKEKIQIRQINDINNNSYKIFDYMALDSFGRWRSKCTYFSLEDALEWHKGIEVEDTTANKEDDMATVYEQSLIEEYQCLTDIEIEALRKRALASAIRAEHVFYKKQKEKFYSNNTAFGRVVNEYVSASRSMAFVHLSMLELRAIDIHKSRLKEK